MVFVAALDALGVPTTSLLAVLGAAGLAIGLALKDSLSNIASGVMLIVLRPFRAGSSIPYPQRSLHVYHHDAEGRPLAQLTAAVEDPDRG